MHFEVVVERLSSLVERVAGGITGAGSSGTSNRESSVFGSPAWESSLRRSGGGRPGETLVPWSTVEDVIKMARDALSAKQRVAELLRAEASRLQIEGKAERDHLNSRAERAETDSGSLLEQLESLISSKRVIALERAELSRTVAQLRAERELICHQLHVDPASANLCGAVESALGVVARQRRQMRIELDTARQALSSSNAMWQAREASLRRALAAAGVQEPPDLPPAPVEMVDALLSRTVRESNTAGDDESMFDSEEDEETVAVMSSDMGAADDDAASHHQEDGGASSSGVHSLHRQHHQHTQPMPGGAPAVAAAKPAAPASSSGHSGPLRGPTGGAGSVAAAAAMWQKRAAAQAPLSPQQQQQHADSTAATSHSGRLHGLSAAPNQPPASPGSKPWWRGTAVASDGGGSAASPGGAPGHPGAAAADGNSSGSGTSMGLMTSPALASSMFINAV